MLVRIRGSAVKVDDWTYKLNFDLPVIYLDDSKEYHIATRMILLDCTFTDDFPTSQFWSLQSDIVDKSAINPKQEISSFYTKFENGSDYNLAYYEPNIVRKYKIQINSFHTSQFILTTLKPDPALEISFVEILLEFSQYARI